VPIISAAPPSHPISRTTNLGIISVCEHWVGGATSSKTGTSRDARGVAQQRKLSGIGSNGFYCGWLALNMILGSHLDLCFSVVSKASWWKTTLMWLNFPVTYT